MKVYRLPNRVIIAANYSFIDQLNCFSLESYCVKRPVIRIHLFSYPLICIGNQRTGFYMIGTSVVKELRHETA